MSEVIVGLILAGVIVFALFAGVAIGISVSKDDTR